MDTAYPRLLISYSGTDEIAQEIKKQAMQKRGLVMSMFVHLVQQL